MTKVSALLPLGKSFRFCFRFGFSFGVGSIAAAVLGWLSDGYGVVVAFWANAVVAAALLLLTLLIYRTFKGVSPASGN